MQKPDKSAKDSPLFLGAGKSTSRASRPNCLRERGCQVEMHAWQWQGTEREGPAAVIFTLKHHIHAIMA
jgi:hypothetical protein